MARVEFNEGDKIRRWKSGLRNPQGALKAIGALMVSESVRAFKMQRFGKTAWAPRGVPNVYGIIADLHGTARVPKKRRFEATPALVDTTRMKSTIAFQLKGTKSVEVGSNLPYSGVLHEGGPIESLPINEQVRDKLAKWLKGAGKKWRKDLGFLFSKKEGETLKGKVEARPFVGLTDQSIKDIEEAIRVTVFEA